jgi:hypothetical protein
MPLYQIARYPFTLRVSSDDSALVAAVERALDAVLRGFQTQTGLVSDPGGIAPARIDTPVGCIHIIPDEPIPQIHILLKDGLRLKQQVEIVDALEPEIVNHAIRQSPGFLWIHGACLRRGDETVLLVAESGTGKTTLSLGLLYHGYRLLTDDIILIDPLTGRVVPVPRCPKVRPPAPEYLRNIGFDLNAEADMFERYVLLPDRHLHLAPVPAPIERIYILSRSGDAPASHSLDATSGILSLLSRSNILATDPTLERAHHLFQNTRFFQMNLRDFPHDLALIADKT